MLWAIERETLPPLVGSVERQLTPFLREGRLERIERDPTSSCWQCRKAADTFLKRRKIREERRAQGTGRFLWAEEVGENVTEMRFKLSLEFLCVCAHTCM